MTEQAVEAPPPGREQLLHQLYEAAELEHNLMCTYLYAAFSLRSGEGEGLSAGESVVVARWRLAILRVAIDEMGHLVAVWNITSALGGSPRFGRGNFPLDPGGLPAGVVVKLAPFGESVLQHFIYLERPEGSAEAEGEGFAPEYLFKRAYPRAMLTPMPMDYETVGSFYASLGDSLYRFVARLGEASAFCGDPALQLSQTETSLSGAQRVVCEKTAQASFRAIVEQGEGAPADSEQSHFQRFLAIRAEYRELKSANPAFEPAFPAAVNPVLRRSVVLGKRVWLEDADAATTVDLANACYALMLRLIAYSYAVPATRPGKALSVDLALGLMRAVTHLAERAARLPAGPSNPHCNAGMSFSALRDAAPLPPGVAAERFFVERIRELDAAADLLAEAGDVRSIAAAGVLADLLRRATRGFEAASTVQPTAAPLSAQAAPVPVTVDGLDEIESKRLTLIYDGRKCIHSRHCVTDAPTVFLANVKGPWIHPDAVHAEVLMRVANVCPSGAIRYRRKDGGPDETAPPVNLIALREAGPYAVRADLWLEGRPAHFRATLCRCGASKNKPYCDGSHQAAGFAASGEPAIGQTEMLAVRDGPLAIDPETDGPLQLRGNLEITAGSGRVVARVKQARLCRCGGSNAKPFCDGTHARIGFQSS